MDVISGNAVVISVVLGALGVIYFALSSYINSRAAGAAVAVDSPANEAESKDASAAAIRARRLQKFQLSASAKEDIGNKSCAESDQQKQGKCEEAAVGETRQHADSASSALSSSDKKRPAQPTFVLSKPNEETCDAVKKDTQHAESAVSVPTSNETSRPNRSAFALSSPIVDVPIQIQEDVPALSKLDHSNNQQNKPDESLIQEVTTDEVIDSCSAEIEEAPAPRVLTEAELEMHVFGTAIADVSAMSLTDILLKEPLITSSLAMAANWWARAVEVSSLPRWKDIIVESTALMLAHRTPEEDLYTPDPTEDLAAAFVELLGYYVVDEAGMKKLRQISLKFSPPAEFITALFSINPKCSSGAIKLILSCFCNLRMDALLQDSLDLKVLAAIKGDRNIGAALAVVMENEVLESRGASSPGSLQRCGALSAVLSISTVVPLAAINFQGGAHNSKPSSCPQLSYFSGMPYSASPSQLWCTNPSLLQRHTHLLCGSRREVLEFLHGLVEKALKQSRERVLLWMAKVIQINHQYFSGGGRAALHEDEIISRDSCSSGYLLNLASIMLNLMSPMVMKDSEKFVALVDWEYTKEDNRIIFSMLPNMVDGSKPASIIAAADEMIKEMVGLKSNQKSYSFPTEIFWLTARAMELVQKVASRRNEHMREAWTHFNHVKQLYELKPSPQVEQMLEHTKQCMHTLHYGWAASQIEEAHFLSQACGWAKFSSSWIMSQATAADASVRFRYLPAGLVKAMCDIWIMAAKVCPNEAMPGLMAADAALFCVELMNRPDLASSPVVQDRLLAVVDTFIMSGKTSLVGVVMDNQIIRQSLAPAILSLYSNCHAVAALDVNEDVSFDKNSIRSRANSLIKHLYNYSLPEPRDSIRVYIKQGVGFEAFVISAFDCIMYNFVEAMKTLAYCHALEKRGGACDSRSPGNVRWMLNLTNATFDVLQMLCEGELLAREAIVGPALCRRVASFLYTCLNYTNSEKKLESLRVKTPEEWGYKEDEILSRPVGIISICLNSSDKLSQHAFLSAFAEHPDFETEGLRQIAYLPGGSALVPHIHLLDSIEIPASTAQKRSACSGTNGGNSNFNRYLEFENGADDLYTAFWLSEEQVAPTEGGFPGGHYFQRAHAVSSSHSAGSNIRAIINDYKKTASLLPTAARDATIVIRYDEESPSYCRAFLTGPVDTPYFGGVFIFDIFFPKDFPNVPPQVQFVNTAGGTVRFHPNLYADGKVCVSLLGTFDGDSSERWDPKQSCLGQVLMSIQSLILGEYNPGAVGNHVTVDGRRVSAADFCEYRIMTLRHAVLSLLQGCRGVGIYASSFPELVPLLRAYYGSIRHRLLAVIRDDLDRLRTFDADEMRNKLAAEADRLLEEFEEEEDCKPSSSST